LVEVVVEVAVPILEALAAAERVDTALQLVFLHPLALN
jgi:hypothetical protein